ncbi:MAG: YkgJ family cysteine cluster protein [Candidatus Heimdallarchaeota archaeon]|nr:YkgJ family cysteine cluster protein [Candidatus Heimdallarchaeota archaeon]
MLSVCQKCIELTGGCCENVTFALFEREYQFFKQRFDDGTAPKNHRLDVHDEEGEIYEYNSKGEPCMYLGEDKQCTIYDIRPTICRTYPILWQEPEDSNDLQYFLDIACPLTYRIPYRDFLTWIDEYQKIIDEMGELEFERDDSQYVNLSELLEQVNLVKLVKDSSLLP